MSDLDEELSTNHSSKNNYSSSSSDEEDTHSPKKKAESGEEILGGYNISKFCQFFSVEEAFQGSKTKSIIHDEKEYGFVYAWFTCDRCCFTGHHLVSMGNQEYIKDCINTNCWWDTDFILSFAALLAHEAHDPTIELIHCQFPTADIGGHCQSLGKQAKTIMSILHGSGHFSILEIDVESWNIMIFDGLSYPLQTWYEHITAVLK
jgi:hypothetical protein